MKWLLAVLAVFFMVAPAMAGEDPYVAIVGLDCSFSGTNYYGQRCSLLTDASTPASVATGFTGADPFYFSPKHLQFMYNEYAAPFNIPILFGTVPQANQYTRLGVTGTEMFNSQTLNNQPEVCDVQATGPTDNRGLHNARTTAGNAGFYEWYIRLPKKPSGEINIVLQCGILKPNAYAAYGYDSIELCAAETGERVGAGTCVRQEVDPGVSPVNNTALPTLTAMVYPGPYNVAFTPFHLTAFKNPSAYALAFDPVTSAMSNNVNSQILDGTSNSKILLKACLDKTVVTKLPITGQINAAGEAENDLEAGDLVYVRLQVPRYNSVDIYCHQQSVRLAGVGETPF